MTKPDESKPAIPPIPQGPKTLTLPTPAIPPRAPLAAQPRLPSLPAAREPAAARSQPVAQSGTYSLGEHPHSASSTPPSPVASAPTASAAAPSLATTARTSIVVSAITAALVSAVTVVAMIKARPSTNAPAPASAAERVTVPELARVPAENIRAIVEAMGLHANVEERPDPLVTGAGVVIAQAPRAGTTIERGSHVAIVLATRPSAVPAQPPQSAQSTQPAPGAPAPVESAPAPAGAAADTIVVPSVLRMFAPEARARLASAGLTVRAVRESFDEDVGQNRVLRQMPAANARVPRGASVDLWVNRE